MKTLGASYAQTSRRKADCAESFFLHEMSANREYRIECSDGLVLILSSPTATADLRVRVNVKDAHVGSRRDLDRLKGSILSFALGARLSPNVPVTCLAEMPDGNSAVLRVPGVTYAG